MTANSPTISEGRIVEFLYELRGEDGALIDRSDRGPMAYLHGAGNIVTGLEEALLGKAVGDKLQVAVPPEKAYGLPSEDAFQKIHRSQFPSGAQIEVGMAFQAQNAEGHPMMVWVHETKGAFVTLTSNHPLAGQTLHFAVEVVSVRDASDEERAHGHVHGPGGHHHG